MAKRARSANRPPQRHLYLIFDDWSWGYSIRKTSLPSDDEEAAEAEANNVTIDRTEQPTPPAIFRLAAPAPRGAAAASCFVAGFGTMIMVMHARSPKDDVRLLVPKRLVPAFDVRDRGIFFAPRPEADPAHSIYIPVGDGRIFALSTRSGSFELLEQSPRPEPGGNGGGLGSSSWRKLPDPPFEPKCVVTSYAVHPDGRIFLSVEGTTRGTFSFPTTEVEDSTGTGDETFAWERHGDWILPFFGLAQFDSELNAWVGFSRYPYIGHLCSCDVPSARTTQPADDGQCPAWKVGKEKLFAVDPDERHIGFTLVYMGGRSRYCLVQCVYKYKDDRKQPSLQCRFLLRVTTFYLKYEKNGDLTTGYSRNVRYYRVPDATTEAILKNPVAFWM
ncbi:hypothetical protein BS78_01G088700 [Paspalum vaginatum]|nr:hypothetical protein BS78_01G088700 [Paspalum vaginatum]